MAGKSVGPLCGYPLVEFQDLAERTDEEWSALFYKASAEELDRLERARVKAALAAGLKRKVWFRVVRWAISRVIEDFRYWLSDRIHP